MSNFYSSTYISQNSSYHKEDSHFKWHNFLDLIKSNNLLHNSRSYSLAEFGCGAGGILKCAASSGLNFHSITGYDINPIALDICRDILPTATFYSDLALTSCHYDIILVSDVLEHLDDPISVISLLKTRCTYLLINLPLELSFTSSIRPSTLLNSYNSVGHIHFYNASSAFALFSISGIHVISHKFSGNYKHNFRLNPSFFSFLRYLLGSISSVICPAAPSFLIGDSICLLCCE